MGVCIYILHLFPNLRLCSFELRRPGLCSFELRRPDGWDWRRIGEELALMMASLAACEEVIVGGMLAVIVVDSFTSP